MANYHVSRCEALINDSGASRELRLLAESLVAIASGVDDSDSMAHAALERIEIVLERVTSMEQRLSELEKRVGPAGTHTL
jgi:hypothetical protein